jgi:two-component system, LuxR family, response regulator FixJ
MSVEPTVFVVDDDPAVLRSIVGLLTSEGYSVESFEHPESFLQRVDPGRPGCLVVDLKMPGVTGIELLQRLRKDSADRPTVVISGHAEIGSVVQAMQLGAVNVLEKPFRPEEFLESVRQALEADRSLRANAEHQQELAAKLGVLTAGELSVLRGMARGLTIEAIAEELGCSRRTVDLRRASLKVRLRVHRREDLLNLIRQMDRTAPAKPQVRSL